MNERLQAARLLQALLTVLAAAVCVDARGGTLILHVELLTTTAGQIDSVLEWRLLHMAHCSCSPPACTLRAFANR